MGRDGLVKYVGPNEPRFDHRYVNGEIESLGLLIEEQRTNLINYSNNYSSSPGGWTLSATGTRAQDIVGPDGVANSAWTITDNDNTGDLVQFYKQISITASSSTNYCISSFVKDVNGTGISPDFYVFFLGSSTKGSYINYNFSTDTITSFASDGGGIQPTIYGRILYPNGCVRIYFVVNDANNGSNTTLQYRIYPNGRGANTTGAMGFYGSQIEIGTFPTSYIPTEGSTKTRTVDRAVIEGSNFTDIFNTNFNNFSMFVNYDNTDTDDGTNYMIVQFWGESTNFDNRVEFFKDNASPYHIETRAFGGGSAIFGNGNLSAGSTSATQKLATSWSVDYSTSSGASRRWAFSFNGESVDVVNDGTGTTIPSLTRIGFGKNPTRTDGFGGKIHFKQISLYSNTLTDSQLVSLTR